MMHHFHCCTLEVKKELPKFYTTAKEMHKTSPLTIVADAAEKDLIGYKAVFPCFCVIMIVRTFAVETD